MCPFRSRDLPSHYHSQKRVSLTRAGVWVCRALTLGVLLVEFDAAPTSSHGFTIVYFSTITVASNRWSSLLIYFCGLLYCPGFVRELIQAKCA